MSVDRTTQTYSPRGEQESLASIHSFLRAHSASGRGTPAPRYMLVGPAEGEQVELPEPVYNLLVRAVDVMASGKSVMLTPQEPQLTTQQAADLLGVSRPTVVRLIESGELPGERTGSRRRIALSDVLDYRERRRLRQYAMLEATSVDIDDEDEPAEVIARLREARKAVARNS